MKGFFKHFRYGEKGFTLIELLVVIAILGVLAAVAIPNVGKFLGKGHKEAASTELHNVQTAAMAAMADAVVGKIPDISLNTPVGGPFIFGNTDMDQETNDGVDVTVKAEITGPPLIPAITVGNFIVGGKDKVQGDYTIATDGTVTQVWYPGIPTTTPTT